MSSPAVNTSPSATSFEISPLTIIERESSFIDSCWDFVRLADGRAFWIHASGKKIPASGNREE